MENIYSVIITAITVLGGTTAFRFYEKRALKKHAGNFGCDSISERYNKPVFLERLKRKIKKEPLEHLEPSMIRLSSIDSTIMIAY
jgi:hypothetical protein